MMREMRNFSVFTGKNRKNSVENAVFKVLTVKNDAISLHWFIFTTYNG